MKTIVPEGYKSKLSTYDTQSAIGTLKRIFEDKLCHSLNLKRVSAPLFVTPESGLNDNLNGYERPVTFDILNTTDTAEIIHSLAKWKRMALLKYNFRNGEGIYTDMNAIRRDDDMDNIHSIYVDQWDWEKVICKEIRNEEYLKKTVQSIVDAIVDTKDYINGLYPELEYKLERKVTFVTSQELEDMYPIFTPKQREYEYAKLHKTIFIMQIGDTLKSGKKHDGRAPDYDDWKLNGDLLFYNETLDIAFEISSMGIRVDEKSMDYQLNKAGFNDRRNLTFHKMLLNGELPLTIGGGIGQSRLSMLILEKAHIGEVQVSIWDEETKETCKKAGIELL